MKQAFGISFPLMAPEGAEGSTAGPSSFDTVADAVAELDRRDQARTEEKAAVKAAAKQSAPVEAVAEEVEADEQPDTDTPLPDEESDDDASDEVTTDEVEEQTEEEEPIDELDEIEQDGKKFKIPKELKDSFLRQADYTKKTQEVAQERQQVHAAYEQTSQIAQQLQQTQAALAQFAQAVIGQPPSIDMIHTDPQGYLAQKALFEQRMGMYQQLQGQGQQLTQHQQQLQQQQLQEYKARELKSLHEHIPELKDAVKARAWTDKAAQTAAKYGFEPKDVMNVTDHRALRLLKDNMEMSEKLARYESASGDVKKKLTNVAPKVQRPGNAVQDSGKSQKAALAKSQFMKSGRSLRDVEKYLRQTD